MPARPLPISTKPPAIDLERTRDYMGRKNHLHRDLLPALDLLEEVIRRNPHARLNRVERADGTVIDTSIDGLSVGYRVEDPLTVLLVELRDLRGR